MGLTFREIAQRLCLSPRTAQNHFMQFVSTGDVSPKQGTGVASGMRKLNDSEELRIIGLLLDDPSLYLSDVCRKIDNIFGINTSCAVCTLLLVTLLSTMRHMRPDHIRKLQSTFPLLLSIVTITKAYISRKPKNRSFERCIENDMLQFEILKKNGRK